MKKTMTRATVLLVVISICMALFAGLAVAESAYVQTEGRVNVRTGAGLDYRSLGTVEKGTRLTYLNETSTDSRGVAWYKVQYNSSTSGWVSSTYASLKNYTQKVTATGGQTYIRSSASLNGKQLGILPKGASATYLNSSSVDDRGVAWYYVSYDGTKGWVSSRYTKLGSGSSAPAQKVTATGGQTNIRNSGNLSAKVLGTLPKGASATYLDQSSTDERGVVWYKVRYDGITGWVSSKYTKLGSGSASSGSTSSGSTSASSRKVVATDGQTNIRSQGNLDGKVLTSLPKGASATYLDSSTVDNRGVTWYKVRYDGVTGWVSSKYTTLK